MLVAYSRKLLFIDMLSRELLTDRMLFCLSLLFHSHCFAKCNTYTCINGLVFAYRRWVFTKILDGVWLEYWFPTFSFPSELHLKYCPYYRLSNYERYPRGTDPILPAVLEFREETEEAFLHAVVTDLDPAAPHFKLAPTYTLYLVARYRASTHYRPELTPTERAHRLTVLLARVAAIIHNVIQVHARNCFSQAVCVQVVCDSSCLC